MKKLVMFIGVLAMTSSVFAGSQSESRLKDLRIKLSQTEDLMIDRVSAEVNLDTEGSPAKLANVSYVRNADAKIATLKKSIDTSLAYDQEECAQGDANSCLMARADAAAKAVELASILRGEIARALANSLK